MSYALMVEALAKRLPELEWHLSHVKTLPLKSLPKGLFNIKMEATLSDCVAEIKQDLKSLAARRDERAALHLTNRIAQKITVLVNLCRLSDRKDLLSHSTSFNYTELTSYQTWLVNIEARVSLLTQQKEAMLQTCARLSKNDTEAQLLLQKEIGAIERELTAYRETLVKESNII